MVDIPNRIGKNGLIYFPDFCQLVLDQIREDEKNGEEDFRRNMFKVKIVFSYFGYGLTSLFTRFFVELIPSRPIFGLRNTNLTNIGLLR